MVARRRRFGLGAALGALLVPGAGAALADSAQAGAATAGADVAARAASPDTAVAAAPDKGDAEASAEAADLLVRMSEALRTLTYSGTFVHETGDSLNSMSILHTFVDGGELERLSALDGEAREVFRDRSLVTCIWPDSGSVVVTTSKPRSPIAMVDASLADDALYVLSLGPDDRVAGRATRQVRVMPRDALRYGYRFWIDSEHHMLLRSKLLDTFGRPVEQVLFTHIEYPDEISRDRFEIRAGEFGVDGLDEPFAEGRSSSPSSSVDDRIEFDGLPAGYREVSERLATMPVGAGTVSHVMLTDGMASVSVYVEHGSTGSGAVGHSRMGAVNAFGLTVDDAVVTAVGEVPSETVERIARAVRLRDG